MKALKQFFVLAAVLLGAEMVIAYMIIRDHNAATATIEAQKNDQGQTKTIQLDSTYSAKGSIELSDK